MRMPENTFKAVQAELRTLNSRSRGIAKNAKEHQGHEENFSLSFAIFALLGVLCGRKKSVECTPSRKALGAMEH